LTDLSDTFVKETKTTTNLTMFCYKKQEFDDTKGVIRIRKSKKDIQHNGLKKKCPSGSRDDKKRRMTDDGQQTTNTK